MTNLTEEYLSGNLHDGDEYYIENKDGEISTMYLYNDTIHWHSFKAKKLKALAEVPSYEEWEKHRKTLLKTQEKNCDLEIINAKLIELLKECQKSIHWYQEAYGAMDLDTYTLLAKLNEALQQ